MSKKPILIEKGDYLLVQPEKRKYFVQVLASQGSKFTVVVDDHRRAHSSEQETFEVERDQVVANLGKHPYVGSSYGVQIEPYLSSSRHKPWGEFHWFVEPSKLQRKLFLKVFDEVANKMRQMGIIGHFPMEVFVRNPKGKFRGHYQHFGSDEALDHLTMRALDWSKEEIRYTLWHEMGHYLETNYFGARQEKRWIKLYHRNVVLSKITAKQLDDLYKDFAKSGKNIDEFENEVQEEEATLFAAVLDFIQDYHALSPKHVAVLIEDDTKLIKEFWPTDPLQLSDMNVTVTEYANKNPNEFWAESFAHVQTSKKIPKVIKKAVQKTLAEIKGL